jgi:hypothetical protein
MFGTHQDVMPVTSAAEVRSAVSTNLDPTTPLDDPAPSPPEDRFGHVETIGAEYIPESERDSRPLNMLAVFFGGNLAFSVIVFGWLPITFGLGFGSAIAASAVGIGLGTLLIGPLSLLGPRTGTTTLCRVVRTSESAGG